MSKASNRRRHERAGRFGAACDPLWQVHDPGYPLAIGKGVTIGHRAIAHACTIGNYCLVGIGAIIMDDAVLEDYVMLGAAL